MRRFVCCLAALTYCRKENRCRATQCRRRRRRRFSLPRLFVTLVVAAVVVACCCVAAVVLLLCGWLAGCKHSAYLYSYVCCRGRFWFFPVTATPRPPFPLPSPLTLPATLDCRTTTVICCISNAPVLHLLHVAMLHALFDYRARNCVSHSTTSAFRTPDSHGPTWPAGVASIHFRRGNLCSSSVLVFNFPACFSLFFLLLLFSSLLAACVFNYPAAFVSIICGKGQASQAACLGNSMHPDG